MKEASVNRVTSTLDRSPPRPGCALRTFAQPFLSSVITETGLDIHRYIWSDLFAVLPANGTLRKSTWSFRV